MKYTLYLPYHYTKLQISCKDVTEKINQTDEHLLIILFCAKIIFDIRRSIMNKKLCLFTTAIALLGCLSFGPAAFAEGFSVAIVDVPQVVNASAQVQALKKEQDAKANEIIKFIEKARKDVASIPDADKKKAAEEKYTKELQAKQQKISSEYTAKLKAIDDSISKQIETQAKAQGYDIVLSKGIVLFGGKDITADIIKVVK